MSKFITETLYAYFKDKENVAAVYLFGSHGRGVERPASDVDIGILFAVQDPKFAREQRAIYLTDLGRLLRKDIHPVILNTAGEVLMKQVFSKGKCIVVNDRRVHARFKMTMFSRIADFEHHRKRMASGFVEKLSQLKRATNRAKFPAA